MATSHNHLSDSRWRRAFMFYEDNVVFYVSVTISGLAFLVFLTMAVFTSSDPVAMKCGLDNGLFRGFIASLAIFVISVSVTLCIFMAHRKTVLNSPNTPIPLQPIQPSGDSENIQQNAARHNLIPPAVIGTHTPNTNRSGGHNISGDNPIDGGGYQFIPLTPIHSPFPQGRVMSTQHRNHGATEAAGNIVSSNKNASPYDAPAADPSSATPDSPVKPGPSTLAGRPPTKLASANYSGVVAGSPFRPPVQGIRTPSPAKSASVHSGKEGP
ncbi:hypothetical protein FQN54_002809 [Arachnomyces sp. PD_36]|nr:hypothetical protein FQN54_002809 [Arachnomyces sp. PD_36]